jgi:hypothetical protein
MARPRQTIATTRRTSSIMPTLSAFETQKSWQNAAPPIDHTIS